MRQLFFLMLFCTERVLSTHPQEAGTGGVGERHGAAREHEAQMKTAAAADAASAGSRPVTTGEALKSESSASLPLEKRLDHVEEATARGDERLRGGPREESRRCRVTSCQVAAPLGTERAVLARRSLWGGGSASPSGASPLVPGPWKN